MRKRNERGLAIAEVVVLVLILVLFVGVLWTIWPGITSRRRGHSSVKDATQLKCIVMAMQTWSEQNKDAFPLPSALDKDDATLVTPADEQFKKDTTGNILSILIWGGFIAAEMTYSPQESSSVMRVDDWYASSNPAGAAVPAKALWDPGFAGTPDQVAAVGTAPPRKPGQGNNSYAHMAPHGDRLGMWKNTGSSTEAVFGNRGPGWTLDPAANPRWRLNPAGASPPGVDSITLLIHGGRNTWEGNIAYNDARVNFETRPDPVDITYRVQDPAGAPGTSKQSLPDNLFVNETDDATRTDAGPLSGQNAWLVMVTSVSGSAAAPVLKMFHD